MHRLSPEETEIVRRALRAWLRKVALDAFDTLMRDPTQTHRIIDDSIAPVERIIEKLQF